MQRNKICCHSLGLERKSLSTYRTLLGKKKQWLFFLPFLTIHNFKRVVNLKTIIWKMSKYVLFGSSEIIQAWTPVSLETERRKLRFLWGWNIWKAHERYVASEHIIEDRPTCCSCSLSDSYNKRNTLLNYVHRKLANSKEKMFR